MWDDDAILVRSIVMMELSFRDITMHASPEWLLFAANYCRAYYYNETDNSKIAVIKTLRKTYGQMHDGKNFGLKESKNFVEVLEKPDARANLISKVEEYLPL